MIGGKLIHCQKALKWYTFTISFIFMLMVLNANIKSNRAAIIRSITKSFVLLIIIILDFKTIPPK